MKDWQSINLRLIALVAILQCHSVMQMIRSAVVLILLVCVCVHSLLLGYTAFAMPDQKEQAIIVAEVKKVLPKGWKVSKTATEQTPVDWYTDSPKSGFLIEAAKDKETVRIYFLPLDWVGIRKLSNEKNGAHYCEGILVGDKYKAISTSQNYSFQDNLYNLFGRSYSTPSIVNSGYFRAQQIFKGKESEADKRAMKLINEHCKSPAEFEEAAHSLIVLGVPAKTAFLKAVREVKGTGRDFFISSLGYIGGDECIEELCKVMVETNARDHDRYYASMALDTHFDKRIAPALLKAIKIAKDQEALAGLLRAVARTQDPAACPDILAAYKLIQNPYYKQNAIQALAACKCKEAIPEMEAVLAKMKNAAAEANPAKSKRKEEFRVASPSSMPGGIPEQASELALLRLKGDWGKPSNKMRLMILPPKECKLGEKINLTIYIENIGTRPFDSWNYPAGLKIDGTFAKIFDMGGISYMVSPGNVHAIYWDISNEIKKKGKHTVEYEVEGAKSKPVSFEVQ